MHHAPKVLDHPGARQFTPNVKAAELRAVELRGPWVEARAGRPSPPLERELYFKER